MGQGWGWKFSQNAHIEGYPNPAMHGLKTVGADEKVRHQAGGNTATGSTPSFTRAEPDCKRNASRKCTGHPASPKNWDLRSGAPRYRQAGPVGGQEFQPAPNWTEIMRMALPCEKHNFKMCTDGSPTDLNIEGGQRFRTWIDKTKNQIFWIISISAASRRGLAATARKRISLPE